MKAIILSLFLVGCSTGGGSPVPIPPPVNATTIPDVSIYLYQSSSTTTRRHDWPDGQAYQVTNAVALSGGDFATLWSYPPFGPFVQANGDGGEVYVTDGTTVRIAATQDGSLPYIQGFYGASCGGTGWILFKNDAPTGSWASLVAKLDDKPIPSSCSATNPAFTRYRLETVDLPFIVNDQPQTVTLPTIISEHYDDSTIQDSTDMERSFFAQGLGRVIWEAWSVNPPGGQDLATRCPPTVYSVAPAPGWQLSDCRVATNLQPGVSPNFGWPPIEAWP